MRDMLGRGIDAVGPEKAAEVIAFRRMFYLGAFTCAVALDRGATKGDLLREAQEAFEEGMT
jgi:hypothetical protein